MEKRKKRRRKGNGWLGLALFTALCAGIVAIVYMYCTGYESWRGKFLPNTYINGVNYSGMTAEEAKALYDSNCEGWALTIIEMGGETETIPYSGIDYELTMGKSFEDLIEEQDYRLWFLAGTRTTQLTTTEGYRYDEALLEEKVRALSCISSEEIRDPVDAKIIKTESGYEISPSDDGNRLKEDEVVALAEEALAEHGSAPTEINLEEADLYLKAEIQTDNEKLQKKFAKLDKVQTTSLNLFLEEAYETLDRTTFLDWMGYEKSEVTIDREQVDAYVAALAEKYDTLRTVRTFHTHDGETVEVGGDDMDSYGFVMDQEATAEAIYNALLAGESKTVEVVFEEYSLCRYSDNDDIGDTYIEISLADQHMWYVVDGEVAVETDVVTGLPEDGRETPSGVFAVLEKLTNHTMSGSYGTAFCNYVLSFNWDGICIHDSTWRSSYGGVIYLSDGSHGCVNTPLDKMKEIFDLCYINTPIVIY